MSTSSMSMSMVMSSTAMAATTATSAAAASATSAMNMDMDMGGSCKVNMLWNWYTIDACFVSTSWHIRSNGAFAATCIGVMLLVVSLEFLRRLGKEYDTYILQKFRQQVAAQTIQAQEHDALNGSHFVTFRANPLQQLVRAIIHAVTFGVAYIVMLLAMYYNGYIIICIVIGAGLGKFVCDWMIQKVSLNIGADKPKVDVPEEPTLCCG